jgi:hypothetical protein
MRGYKNADHASQPRFAKRSFDITPHGKNPSVMMLGPGRTVGHDSYADTILSPEELSTIQNPGSGFRLYSYGTVRYKDTFGKPRFTNFCHFVDWKKTSTGLALSVHPSEQHNDAN